MKVERLQLLVDHRYESFLKNMPNPLQLNQMRTMKEFNYTNLRQLLSKHLGNPVLRLIKENQEALGLDSDIFDLVYEGFWDLYTFKPKVPEISAKKLSQWITKINLHVTKKSVAAQEADADVAEQEEELNSDENPASKRAPAEMKNYAEEAIDPTQPICSVVRIRIPKLQPEPEMDDEGNPIPANYNEDDLEEIPFEDKCALIETTISSQHIWAIN